VRTPALTPAVLLAGLLACSGTPPAPEATLGKDTSEIKSVIQRLVADPGRRDRLLAHADGIDAALRGHAADYGKLVEEYRRLNNSFDTSQQRVEELFGRYEQRCRDSRARLLELHFQMIRFTSPQQEWPPIAKLEADMLQSTVAVSASGQPILAATAFMGGSAVVLGNLATDDSIAAIKSSIRAAVKDPAKSRAAQQAVERWRVGAGDYFKASNADHEAIVALVKRHDAARAEFDAVNRRMDERDARVVLDFITGRETLRKQLTREEWAALFKDAR